MTFRTAQSPPPSPLPAPTSVPHRRSGSGPRVLRRLLAGAHIGDRPEGSPAGMGSWTTFEGLKSWRAPDSLAPSLQPFREGRGGQRSWGTSGDSGAGNGRAAMGTPMSTSGIRPLARRDSLEEVRSRARPPMRSSLNRGDLATGGVFALRRAQSFGFNDASSTPHAEGSGIPVTNSRSLPQGGDSSSLPLRDRPILSPLLPEGARPHGTYVVIRKLTTRVAAFRQYIHEKALVSR